MKFKTFTLRTNLLSKLLLSLALLIGSVNVWAQQELPYSYGFENNDLAAEGWTTTPYYSMSSIQSTPVKSGTHAFRFYYNSTYVPQYLISPELEYSASGVDVSFYYTCNNGSAKVKFCVGYSTSDSETASFTFGDEVTVSKDANWHLYENSFPAGTKYIAIQFTATDYRLFIDDINIDITEEYKRPKNFALSSYNSNSATFSWTNGRDETAWQITYSTKEGFDPDTEGVKVAVGTNPYTLTGLTDGVTYYAYVRSNYNGNYSAWCNDKVEIAPRIVLLLNDAANTSTYAPIHNNTNYGTVSQFIIPAADLTLVQNRLITKLTLYSKESAITWSDVTFDVYLDTPEGSTYSSTGVTLKDWGTKVCNGKTLSVIDGKMNIDLDVPYSYSTGNLLIGLQENGKTASSVTSTWYGVNEATDYTSAYTYKYSEGGSLYYGSARFSPRVTIETVSPTIPVTLGYNGYATFACPRPLDLTAEKLPSGLKAYKATVSGSRVYFTEVDQAVAANTGVLLEGAPEGNYDIPVADSGTSLEGVNDFLVNSIGGTFSNDEDYTYYALKKNSSPLVFGTFNPSTAAIPTNKAYLKVENEYAVKGLTFEFDNPTAVQSIKEAQPAMKGAVYDLSGRKVMNSSLKKGLYIIGGKKMLVK